MADYTAMSILVVEPSLAQTRFVRQCLEGLGCTCIQTCTSQAEALQILRGGSSPDLVLSAMYLPDGTGAQIAQTLREDGHLQDSLFALLSSEKNPRYLEPLRQLGVIALMRKPIDTDSMRQTLDAVQNITSPHDLRVRDYLDEVRVLLVDDSRTARHFMRRVLRSLGLERIVEAEDGQQAAHVLASSSFDLLVTDLHMPHMDGMELARYVRNESLNPSLPILMVTSEQAPEILRQCAEAGADFILDKPFEPSVVQHALETLLNAA